MILYHNISIRKWSISFKLNELKYYCISGADSLCACTESGKLHFYAVGPCRRRESESSSDMQPSSIKDSLADDIDGNEHLQNGKEMMLLWSTSTNITKEVFLPRFSGNSDFLQSLVKIRQITWMD